MQSQRSIYQFIASKYRLIEMVQSDIFEKIFSNISAINIKNISAGGNL
jgi:hypothetical protein